MSLGVPSAFAAVGSSPMIVVVVVVVSVSLLVMFPIGRVGMIVVGITTIAIVIVVAFVVVVFATTTLFWFQSIPSTGYGRIHRTSTNTNTNTIAVVVLVLSSRIVSFDILG